MVGLLPDAAQLPHRSKALEIKTGLMDGSISRVIHEAWRHHSQRFQLEVEPIYPVDREPRVFPASCPLETDTDMLPCGVTDLGITAVETFLDAFSDVDVDRPTAMVSGLVSRCGRLPSCCRQPDHLLRMCWSTVY